MQDIPRNELLDKLAAGWKVRVKDSTKEINPLNSLADLQGVCVAHFVERMWEGEPPKPHAPDPKKRFVGCTLQNALRLSESPYYYVRRPQWPKLQGMIFGNGPVALTVEDILANDWEVWG